MTSQHVFDLLEISDAAEMSLGSKGALDAIYF